MSNYLNEETLQCSQADENDQSPDEEQPHAEDQLSVEAEQHDGLPTEAAATRAVTEQRSKHHPDS